MAGRRSPAFTDQLSLDYVRQSQAMPHVCREAVRNALMFAQRPEISPGSCPSVYLRAFVDANEFDFKFRPTSHFRTSSS
jgi:hypothetical protein